MQLIELQTAATQIEKESWRIAIAKRAQDRDPHEPGFFGSGNDFQIDFGNVPYALDQDPSIAGFARCARCYGPIRGNAERVHDVPEFTKRGSRVAQSFAIEFPGRKNGMAEPHGRADGLNNFPIIGGVDSGDHQAERIGPGVNRRELDGFA
jgi:hypothetical protein